MAAIEKDYQQKIKKQEESDKQTVLNKDDMRLLTINDHNLSEMDTIKMHVKNFYHLEEKAKNQIYAKIQSRKAMHAREIFLKELNMVGWQFKNKTANPDPMKASLEELS